MAWFDTARLVGIALYLPRLALEEVRAIRPDAAPLLADLLSHPSVVLGEIDAATADQVDQLLLAANVFDALAGHVVYVARQRAWPALSADPDRLRRIDPALEVDLLSSAAKLVDSVDAEHLYFAAMNSTACRLTP